MVGNRWVYMGLEILLHVASAVADDMGFEWLLFHVLVVLVG
jgi:hypothetical protein